MPARTALVAAPERLEALVGETLPEAAVIGARSGAEAQSLLAATAFDLLVLEAETAGENLEGIVRSARALGVPVVCCGPMAAGRALPLLGLGAHCAGTDDDLLAATLRHADDAGGDDAGGADREAFLREVAQRLSSIYHDLNNPLAIISGNAQYYRELAGSMGVGEELVGPVADIEEAADRMGALVERVNVLKHEVLGALDAAGEA